MLRAEDEMELQIVKCAGHERSLVRRPAGAEEICFESMSKVSVNFIVSGHSEGAIRRPFGANDFSTLIPRACARGYQPASCWDAQGDSASYRSKGAQAGSHGWSAAKPVERRKENFPPQRGGGLLAYISS
jgi:hypothetical protein